MSETEKGLLCANCGHHGGDHVFTPEGNYCSLKCGCPCYVTRTAPAAPPQDLVEAARQFAATKQRDGVLFGIETNAFDTRTVGISHALMLDLMAEFARSVAPAQDQWVPLYGWLDDELPTEKGEYDVTAPGLDGVPTVFTDEWNGSEWTRYVSVIAWRKRPAPYEPPSKGAENHAKGENE